MDNKFPKYILFNFNEKRWRPVLLRFKESPTSFLGIYSYPVKEIIFDDEIRIHYDELKNPLIIKYYD